MYLLMVERGFKNRFTCLHKNKYKEFKWILCVSKTEIKFYYLYLKI